MAPIVKAAGIGCSIVFDIAISLWAGKPRNRGSIPVGKTDYFVSCNLPKRSGTYAVSLLMGKRNFIPEAKVAGA
jgi:hypothetical protein